MKVISLKDDNIDNLENKIDELLAYGKATTDKLDNVQDDLTETKEEVSHVKEMLVETALRSTKNPSNESKHHYFAATLAVKDDGCKIVWFIAGQKDYVDKTINSNVSVLKHQLVINPFYNANPIDLRQNVFDEFKIRRSKLINELNEKNKSETQKANDKLKKEINAHNRTNPGNKRSYGREMKKKILIKDIEVKFKKLSFEYYDNPYMSFNDVLNIIKEVNHITQSAP